MSAPRRGRFAVCLLALALASIACPSLAQPADAPAASRVAPRPAGQGVAVVGGPSVRDDAFALARAVYASSLRPAGLDEVRARVLAGDPPPANATRALRDLAELRAGIAGDDAASRRLLAAIAEQLGVRALLVVRGEPVAATAVDAGPDADGPAEPGDAGADLDAAAPAPAAPAGPAEVTRPVALLFLADAGELDAARYAPAPDQAGPSAWRGVVASLERRFPPAAPARAGLPGTAPPPARSSESSESRPFYASPWFWGALGAAALVGGAFYFASRDTSSEPIHLQMRLPP